MNLNKNFLTEVIKYLISRGVTLADVLDAFNAQFEYHEQNISRHDELRKPLTDIDMALCVRELEKQGFNKDIKEHVTVTENITESPYKLVPTPLTNVSLSPNIRDYPTSTEPRGKGVSKARKMLFEVVEGKTVLEHLKANNINYKLFDTRIRKNWTMEKACTTPMTRVIKPYTKSKKPEETLETKTETLETQSNTEKPTESVTNAIALNGNNVTAVIPDTPNPDAIREDKNDVVEKALKKFVTHAEESKKPKETKSDLTVLEVCQKMNVTIHELKEMVSTGEFPQPDCDKKWSVKLLKKEGII